MIKLLHPSLMACRYLYVSIRAAVDVSGGGGPFCHCAGCIVGTVGDGREVKINACWVDIFVRLIVEKRSDLHE